MMQGPALLKHAFDVSKFNSYITNNTTSTLQMLHKETSAFLNNQRPRIKLLRYGDETSKCK